MNRGDPLGRFVPGTDGPWDDAAASHLLRRAGFAPSIAEIESTRRLGLDAAVDQVLDSADDSPEHAELDALGPRIAMDTSIDRLRGWWIKRLCRTRRPIRGRLALLWQNHFATSNVKVQSPAMMLQQLRGIERGALGPFQELLLAMARDPAMIVWLDGAQNVRGRPNENFARELFELFSLGVGNYSERDIQEAARAFTGWRQKNGVFHASAADHDDGVKTVLGREGAFTGEDIVAITVEEPACARFIAGKLAGEFIGPKADGALIDAFAARLRDTGLDIRSGLRTLLTSRAFFDPSIRWARIKSPTELVVGLVRSLGLSAPADRLARAVSEMGQPLFEPPSVKGWDGHRAWLNSASMMVRLNIGSAAGDPEYFDAGAFLRANGLRGRDAIVAACFRIMLDGRTPLSILEHVATLSGSDEAVLRGLVRVLACSPEYQFA